MADATMPVATTSRIIPLIMNELLIRAGARAVDGVVKEVVIYDKTRDVGTALNAFAAEVWDRCDGQSSPAAIAQALSEGRPEPVGERAVWLAVDKLSRAKLLAEPIKMPPSVLGGTSRREVMRTLGLGAAAAVPVVLSISAPTVAQAASCSNTSCLGQPCCPGFHCVGEHCEPG